jgi:uncharacterized protein involved in exopolysaccharide biosynthesis
MLAKRYLNYTTPMFESTAKIKLADNHEGVPNSNLYKDFDVFTNTNKIAAEVELIKSKVLVAKAISKLDVQTIIYRVGDLHKTELYKQSPIIIKTRFTEAKWLDKTFAITISKGTDVSITLPDGCIVNGKIGSVIVSKVGEIAILKNTEAFDKKPNLQLNDRYEFMVYSEDNLINKVISDLDVMPIDKDVPVLRISYKSPDAQKAANVTNAIAAAYIADYIDEKFKSADTASDFLHKELGTYRNKLAASEDAIEQYRDKKGIINIRQETETDLRKIADLKKQQAALQMSMVAIDSLNTYIRQGHTRFDELAPNYESFTDLLSTEMVKKIKELQREKKDLLNKYTPEHEYVKATDAKINDINLYLIESIKNTGVHLHNEYNNLQNTITEAEKKFIGLPTKEKTMAIMEREFGLDEKIYCFLHEKRTEAEIAKAAKISFHRIIAEGEVPKKPVSPNTTIIKVFSGFLGFLFGIAFVYFIHFLKARVNNQELIYKNSGTPISTSIPFIKNTVKAAAVFRKWMFELDIKGYLTNGSVVTISSFGNKEGKKFIADNLLQQAKMNGKKVLMVDADGSLQANKYAHYLNLQQLKQPWQQATVWNSLLAEWRKQYDMLIIKNFPIYQEASSIVLMSDAQLNLVVLDSRRTKKQSITDADLMQEELKLPNMQFILNRAGYTPTIFTYIGNIIKK